jgi:hypothetical protein
MSETLEHFEEKIKTHMQRSFKQWENCDPKAMATTQSQRAVEFAFEDAKKDIAFLHRRIMMLAEIIEDIEVERLK